MRNHLILAGLLAISVPAFAAPDTARDAIKSDTMPQPTTANDTAVATGTNVQTAQAGQAASADAPPSGPQKQGGTVVRTNLTQTEASAKER